MQQIDHIVVLMLENHSFDHMLGFTRRAGYDVNGLDGSQSNPVDPTLPDGPRVKVSADAEFVLHYDPGHQVPDVNVQLFGRASGPPSIGAMNEGFIYSYGQQSHVTPEIAETVMRCFAPTNLPVLTTLAEQFPYAIAGSLQSQDPRSQTVCSPWPPPRADTLATAFSIPMTCPRYLKILRHRV